MRLSFTSRNQLVVSWPVDPDLVRCDLPSRLVPVLDAQGFAVVSVVAFERTDVRLGDTPGPAFAELAIRTYLEQPEAASYVFSFRVTAAGLGGALAGVPYRPARITVEEGRVDAPGLGFSARYCLSAARVEPPFRTGADRRHEVIYYEAAGLRRVEGEHDPVDWVAAELNGPVRAEPVLALGFDLAGPPSALAARETRAALELPPEKAG